MNSVKLLAIVCLIAITSATALILLKKSLYDSSNIRETPTFWFIFSKINSPKLWLSCVLFTVVLVGHFYLYVFVDVTTVFLLVTIANILAIFSLGLFSKLEMISLKKISGIIFLIIAFFILSLEH